MGLTGIFINLNTLSFCHYINNNFDFAEMLSEMLGELNASHTGSGYRFQDKNGDQTAKLGAFFDPEFAGTGVKIVEVIDKSPLLQDELKNQSWCYHRKD